MAREIQKDPPRELSLFEAQDARSIINIVTPVVKDSILYAKETRPDLFEMDEHTLWKKLGKEEAQPSPTDNRLRLRFWDEYDRAQQKMDPMNMRNIFSGICFQEFFYKHYLRRPEKVAWLLTPPVSYQVKMEEALAFGIEQMRDILQLEHTTEGGSHNVKLMALKMKIVAMLDVRINGSVVQRVEQKNLNLNYEARSVDQAIQDLTMEEIEAQIAKLEKRDLKKLASGTQALEAELVDAET